MPSLFLDHALLPLGWSANVRMDIESGRIAAVTADAHADGAQHCPGVALPGLPNLHSHTFQRGMAGFAERRGDSEDNFWTWRQVMYHFLGLLTPDDIEAIAAFAFVEMLESGFTSVAEKFSEPSALSRVASSISTSAGEPDRVGTIALGTFVLAGSVSAGKR